MSMDSRRTQYVVWNMEQGLSDSEKLQGRNNIGAAALASLAPAFESRSATNYAWKAGEVCSYGGAVYLFGSDHTGDWTGSDVGEIKLSYFLGAVMVGDAGMTDSDIVNGVLSFRRNNAMYTLTTSAATLIIELQVIDDTDMGSLVPNFVFQIANSNALTLYVRLNQVGAGPGGADVLSYCRVADAAGNELDACAAGEVNQVTCVGGCWTQAKFVAAAPSP